LAVVDWIARGGAGWLQSELFRILKLTATRKYSFCRTPAATLPAGKTTDWRSELFLENKTHRECRMGTGVLMSAAG